MLEHCALYSIDGDLVDFVACRGGLTGWSGISGTMEPQHMERMDEHIPEIQRTIVQVPTKTLQGVLLFHNIKQLDYCCLDIEGAEYPVLAVFPFEEFDIDVFDIEDNFGNYPIEALMKKNGYEKLIRLGVSDIYRRKR